MVGATSRGAGEGTGATLRAAAGALPDLEGSVDERRARDVHREHAGAGRNALGDRGGAAALPGAHARPDRGERRARRTVVVRAVPVRRTSLRCAGRGAGRAAGQRGADLHDDRRRDGVVVRQPRGRRNRLPGRLPRAAGAGARRPRPPGGGGGEPPAQARPAPPPGPGGGVFPIGGAGGPPRGAPPRAPPPPPDGGGRR